jgi:recombination protein RecA
MPATKKKGKKESVQKMTPEGLRKLLNKEFGEGTARLASDPSLQIVRIPSGILAVDALLRGGFPRNRSVELSGNASVGKTTLSLKTAASAQQMDGLSAYVDCESSFDPVFAQALGVDIDALDYHRQKSGERVVAYMETLLYAGLHDVIILDSVASLLPEQEKNATLEKGSMGMEQAKMMSKAMRKLTTANHKTVLIFINQLRDNIGVSFGKKTTTPGGRALPHYSGIRIEMVKVETLKEKKKYINEKTGEISERDTPKAHRVLCRVEKDKTGSAVRPYAETTFVFDYDRADIDQIEDLLYVGRQFDLVGKDGDYWWVDGYDDESIRGRKKFKRWLSKNVAVAEELEERIREVIVSGEEEDSEEDEEGDDE